MRPPLEGSDQFHSVPANEAEWEYAAAGGSDEREYPWGSTAPNANGQYSTSYADYACHYQTGTGACTGLLNIAPVGTATLGAGRWGHLDMAGDMSQLNLDSYAAYVTPCTDCVYMDAISTKVAHGGDFSAPISYLLPTHRTTAPAGSRSAFVGFRCARTP